MARLYVLVTLLVLLTLAVGVSGDLPSSAARGSLPPPTFVKFFTPDTIGPGSISTLQFDIINNDRQFPVTELAFTDSLPAAVTIATPAQAVSGCGGILTAPDGGTTISFSDGAVGAGATCSIRVDVTSSTLGQHQNVTSDLTSSVGLPSAPAEAALTIDGGLPGFSKSFTPSSIPLGGRSTLTFTIDNTASQSDAFNLTFTDNLPVGLEVAGPPNATTDCVGSVITAAPGSDVVSFSPIFTGQTALAAGASCTVSVDLVGSGGGTLGNTSGELMSEPGPFAGPRSSGKSGAVIEVTVDPLALDKDFLDDPVPPGGTVTLEFTIANRNRDLPATDIAFTDDLNAALTGLAATGLPAAGVCGAGSQLTGTSVLSLTGGNLLAEGSCSFSVNVQVPADALPGVYDNLTSPITGSVGSMVVGSAAEDPLFVQPAPMLTKEFIDDPVGAGGSVTLEFTIVNTSSTSPATDIAFEDIFDAILPTASSIPVPGFCGAGSTADFTPPTNFSPASLQVSGASLGPGASCTFQLVLDVLVGAPPGTYPNATSAVTATVDASTVTGNPASDDLVVLGAPALVKEFTDDPVAPGATATLEFTLTHGPFAPGDATAIAFTDDLSFLGGLAAIGLPMSDVCGAGSQINGVTLLTFTGGSLAPGDSCTFAVTLQVPPLAPPGPVTNTSSAVTATVSGVAASGSPATDDLRIAGLELTKEFTDDPVIPGGTVTLQFTIRNTHPTLDAADILFTDSLGDSLSGLTATGLPLIDPCGQGSQLIGSAGDTLLTLIGGGLTAGAFCIFDVTLQVPAATPSDTYSNTTEGFSATMGGPQRIFFDNAADELIVSADQLVLTKEFTDDPVAPGDPVTLEFTLINLDVTEAATDITFTDNLEATLSGLVAVGLPPADVCGAGSQIDGTGNLSFTGGSLAAGGSCTFSVSLQVPAAAAAGSYTNTTSAAAGMIGSLGVIGDPAIDDLEIDFFAFSKKFKSFAIASGTTALTFTIRNLNPAVGASNITFFDRLDDVIAGLVAIDTPLVDVCGAGSRLEGTSILTLHNGTLAPGQTCVFEVFLRVPGDAIAGSHINTTSELLVDRLAAAAPAVAELVIALFADGFESGDTSAWSSQLP